MNRVFSIYVSTVIKMAVNFGHKFPLCRKPHLSHLEILHILESKYSGEDLIQQYKYSFFTNSLLIRKEISYS